MPSVYPDFYEAFSCRASACRHSCCRGWEIDVDDAAARLYRSLPGPLGEDLRAALEEDGEGVHFRLAADDRCPFLQPDGLCRLIRELGEEALCDICALHPRFYQDVGDFELCGLGLSCEAVCDLLLAEAGPLRFLVAETGQALTLPALLARLGHAVSPEQLAFHPRPDREGYAALLAQFAQTEPIDQLWPRQLEALRRDLDAVLSGAEDYARRYDAGRYDRIFAYILYRQLERLETWGLEALLAYARRNAEFIFLQDAVRKDTAAVLRRWSEQIEYSTENVALLLRLFA